MAENEQERKKQPKIHDIILTTTTTTTENISLKEILVVTSYVRLCRSKDRRREKCCMHECY